MRVWTETHREGTNMGPVDWEHETAKDMPPIWREAEKAPDRYFFNGRPLLAMCMYDGWPYWKPLPAVLFTGPLGRSEWAHFNSYGVGKHSIVERAALNIQDRK
jgi:hypothetical protein